MERIYYKNEDGYSLFNNNGYVAYENYMQRTESNKCYFDEIEIIEKINKNEDGFFDFSKVLVDIGSEIGIYPRYTNFSYNYMFEGNKTRIIMSEFNMLIGGKEDTFEIHNVLLSDKKEKIKYDGFFTEYSPIDDKQYSKENENVLNATTLDSFNIQNIGLIKIDVEGMEEKVLRGAVGTIIRNNYPPILFELWGEGMQKMTQEQMDRTLKFLIELGYEVKWRWGDYETHLALHTN